jgi:very-short-patch-repair endonuclease
MRATEAEKLLWGKIRDRQIEGFKFRRQQLIGSYIADFVCFEHRLIIELDGGQHAEMEGEDGIRDSWMRAEGFEVIRFWNNDVFQNLEGVLETIRKHLISPHPNPLPHGERGR